MLARDPYACQVQDRCCCDKVRDGTKTNLEAANFSKHRKRVNLAGDIFGGIGTKSRKTPDMKNSEFRNLVGLSPTYNCPADLSSFRWHGKRVAATPSLGESKTKRMNSEDQQKQQGQQNELAILQAELQAAKEQIVAAQAKAAEHARALTEKDAKIEEQGATLSVTADKIADLEKRLAAAEAKAALVWAGGNSPHLSDL